MQWTWPFWDKKYTEKAVQPTPLPKQKATASGICVCIEEEDDERLFLLGVPSLLGVDAYMRIKSK